MKYISIWNNLGLEKKYFQDFHAKFPYSTKIRASFNRVS